MGNRGEDGGLGLGMWGMGVGGVIVIVIEVGYWWVRGW